MVEGDVAKLPKWAQQKIGFLERDIADLKEQRRNNWSSGGDTDVFINNYEKNIPLPANSSIIFEMGDEERDNFIEVRKTQRGRRHVVEIYASGRNSHRLLIEPASANLAMVTNLDLDRKDQQ